ncbi:MAG: polysaccharide biosynthesis protein [Sedimentisphaerales bacterium]|nr:polysaccharide biosynthesis protein [Sedimentisphaerales bacterium]
MTESNMPKFDIDQPLSGLGSFVRALRMMVVHVLLFAAALFLSFLVFHRMRTDSTWFPWLYLHCLVFVLVVKLIIFGLGHHFQGWWRYVSVSDLLAIIKASFYSVVLLIGGYFVMSNTPALQRLMPVFAEERGAYEAIMFMDLAATIVAICGVRLAIRLYYEEKRTVSDARLSRLLIIGAGNAGEGLLREIRRMSESRYEVVGFIDDNPRKWKARIHGVPVLGPTSAIREIAAKRKVDEIAIAMPSVSHKELRKVINHCEGTKLRFSTVPDLVDIAAGKVNVSQMRDVDINDLLGREPVTLDTELISKFIKGKTVLITGAGGSIGSEMCRQVGPFEPKRLLLLEQAENGLFFVERELRRDFPQLNIIAIICDCADKARVDYIFDRYKPEVVIHAAAHKHVPLMETNPGEAIKNNVTGTRNIARAADRVGTSNFVMISTDKAVNPTSIMGSSKRLAEMSIQCLNQHSETDFVTVRFGNVLGSNGSVIPIFRQQIADGGPVTVTHPEMQRYFMTIPEASQLVLQAATMGRGGEIFVLDMGEPVKIVDLARDLITLSGFTVGEDIEIEFTGMRPGEKLFEELAITGEGMQETRHPKIFIWQNVPGDEKVLDEAVERLMAIANDSDHEAIVGLIKTVVPEYVGDVDHEKLRKEYEGRSNGNGHDGGKDEAGQESSSERVGSE